MRLPLFILINPHTLHPLLVVYEESDISTPNGGGCIDPCLFSDGSLVIYLGGRGVYLPSCSAVFIRGFPMNVPKWGRLCTHHTGMREAVIVSGRWCVSYYSCIPGELFTGECLFP